MSGRRFALEGRTSTTQLRVEPMPETGRVHRRAHARVLTARKPVGLGWFDIGEIGWGGGSATAYGHIETDTQVLSALEDATLPRSGKVGPQWHISIVDRTSREPARPSDVQLQLARCAFGMLEAEEDNHHPGNARHFWMPVDPSERVDCECKTDEVTIEEPDGYRWTNPADGPCRGCENEEAMRAVGIARPCLLHTINAQERRCADG